MKYCSVCQQTYPDDYAVCPRDSTQLTEVSMWAEGTIIKEKYRILGKVGQGGMGTVYKVLHLRFNEPRAIKVLNADLLRDAQFAKRFQREAVMARRLQHPNVVRVDDIDEAEDGCPFIVMEYIEGSGLNDLIRTDAPLPASRVCSIIKQVAAALDAAHQLGMVHRDIKPDNIVLVHGPAGEQAKVLDFGIAKLKEAQADEAAGAFRTATGTVLGTLQYMSPEQAMGKRGDELDGRSDLYSLGVVAYQMLSGDLPLKADTTTGWLLAHSQTLPTPIDSGHPELDIPKGLAGLVMRLLEKSRDLRPPTARALVEEIERAEEEIRPLKTTRFVPPPTGIPTEIGEAAPAAPAERGSQSGGPARLAIRRVPGWRVWVAVGVSALALAGGAWYFRLNRAAAHAKLGQRLYVAHNLDEAIREFREAVHLKPEDIASHIALANALTDKADEEKGDPKSAIKDFDASIAEYREALKIDPNRVDVHLRLGTALKYKYKLDDAIAEYRQAARIQPDNPEAHYGLGSVFAFKYDNQAAISEFREALRLRPDYAEAHKALGDAFSMHTTDKTDMEEAIREYREAIRLAPEDSEAHRSLGVALEQDDLDGAIREYNEALWLKRDDALTHEFLAEALANKGDVDGSVREYRESLRLTTVKDPVLLASWRWGLGKALFKKGDYDGAIAEYREALRLAPVWKVDLHNFIGRAFEKKGDRKSAIEEYKAGRGPAEKGLPWDPALGRPPRPTGADH